MKSFLRSGFAALTLALSFNLIAAVEVKAQGAGAKLNETLKRMEINRNSIVSLRSNVTMVKYNAQLDERDTTEGTSIYLPVKNAEPYVRIDWTKPVQEVLSVVKGQYVVYRPRLKQYFTGNSKNAKGNGKANNALAFMNMSKAELKANYNISYLGDETLKDGTKTTHLLLNPKTATQYKSADLWVDYNGMPIQAKVSENNGDTTTVFLSDIRKNATINANDFKVKLPSDAIEIKG